MSLFQILYKSTAQLGSSPCDIRRCRDEIVGASVAANAAADLTGALLLASNSFIQVIEGPMESLESCFERICCDLRHKEVKVIKLGRVDRRLFGGWPMLDIEHTGDLGALAPLLHPADKDRIARTNIEAAVAMLHELGKRQRLPRIASSSPLVDPDLLGRGRCNV